MIKNAVKTSLLLLGCTTVTIAHAIDLVEFGKNCLVEEKRLNTEKNSLDNYKQEQDLANIEKNQLAYTLKSHKDERERIEIAITDCHGSLDPDSTACHKIRNRYNQLIYLENKIQSDVDRLSFKEFNINNDHEYDKLRYQQALDRFVARCQSSNTHYNFINTMEAYQAVCSTPENKQMSTCSLF